MVGSGACPSGLGSAADFNRGIVLALLLGGPLLLGHMYQMEGRTGSLQRLIGLLQGDLPSGVLAHGLVDVVLHGVSSFLFTGQ